MRAGISSWNQYSIVGHSLGSWVWGLLTALGGVPGHTSSLSWGGSKCALFVTLVGLHHSCSAIRFWGLSLAGNGKGISRKPKTREGKLLPPVKGRARVRVERVSGSCRDRRVEMESAWILSGSKEKVRAPKARTCHKLLCLLCDFDMELVPCVPRSFRSLLTIPRTWENAVCMFSEVQQPTETSATCVWFLAYLRQETQKSSWKIYQEKRRKYKWNQITRHTRCEGAEECKIIFLFYSLLCNWKPSLYSWGRGRAGEPMGETESDKRKLVIWNPTTLSCTLALSFEVSLLELGLASYAASFEKDSEEYFTLKVLSDEEAASSPLSSWTVQWALRVNNLMFRLLPDERKNKPYRMLILLF